MMCHVVTRKRPPIDEPGFARRGSSAEGRCGVVDLDVALREELFHTRARDLVDHRHGAREPSDDVDRQIVLGRSEPAGADHDVGAPDRRAQCGGDIVSLIAAAGHPSGGDVEVPESLGQICRVRVHDLAAAQLVADRQDLRSHRLELYPVRLTPHRTASYDFGGLRGLHGLDL